MFKLMKAQRTPQFGGDVFYKAWQMGISRYIVLCLRQAEKNSQLEVIDCNTYHKSAFINFIAPLI